MSTYCETVEELVTATSECPATDIIMVQVSTGSGTSTALPGIAQPTLVSTGSAVSQVIDDAYALMTGAAAASSVATPTVVITGVHVSAAQGRSSLFAVFEEALVSSAAAASALISTNMPQPLTSSAVASSTVTINTTAVSQLTGSAQAASSVVTGLLESVTSAAAASSVATPLRQAYESSVSAAEGSSVATMSITPQAFLLVSTGDATSGVVVQVELNHLAVSAAEVSADVWYKDPARIAWLMNTETAAVSWYDNFDFESIAQLPGKVLAVGPDGLYELTGATDSDEQIDAAVVSGLADFEAAQTKRVEEMYFSYTSDGVISVTAEAYESGHAPYMYLLEQRAANVPRNSRATPGKGLWGRYWRMTIRNVAGADFEIHDASVDIAVSTRRV
jgi:hypothetical protein